MLLVTCHQDPAVNVGTTETRARSWKLTSKDPGGRCLHQQLGGLEVVNTIVASSDKVRLKNDDITIFTIKIYLGVPVGEEAASMIISALL